MKTQRGFTLIELLCTVFVIGLLMALTLPAVQSSREAARRLQCGNNLKQIGIALNHYEATHGYFPAIVSPTGYNPGKSAPYSAHSFSPLARMLSELDQVIFYRSYAVLNPCPCNAVKSERTWERWVGRGIY